MGEAERIFTAAGSYRTTMDMVLGGPDGAAWPEFKFPSADRRLERDDLLLYGLEIAGPGGHWVEFSRPICAGQPSRRDARRDGRLPRVLRRSEEDDAAPARRPTTSTSPSRRAFLDRGFTLGHVTGHSIGMTMIEHPRIGEGNDVELRENMVVSMHPHAITKDERACLYMQDTWLVTKDGGVPFSAVPLRIYTGAEGALA